MPADPANYGPRSLGPVPYQEEPAQQPEQDPVEAVQAAEEQPEPQEPQETQEVSDNMPHGTFKLEKFSGDGTQDIESYLKLFEQWQICTNANDEQSLAALWWHLSS